jgi:flagella synthesis protein FlgN
MTSHEFLALLRQEHGTFERFLDTLQDEQTALVNGEIDRLTDIAQTKSNLVIELTRLAEARNHFLSSQDLPADKEGMTTWLSRQAATAEAQDIETVWNELLRVAASTRLANETNGKMIELKLQHNQQALAVLMSAANQTTLYGPDGQHLSGTGGRHRDKV